MSALEEAVYWVEYVIKFRGAPFLRSSGVDLPWYQFWLIDVVAFLLITSTVVILIAMYVIRGICCKKTKNPKTCTTKAKMQ